jgi:hypothetical protein
MEALVIARNAYKGMYVGNKTRSARAIAEEEMPSSKAQEERYNNKNYNNDDGEDKEERTEEDKDYKTLQKLPNVNRIEEIINKFQHFELQSVLAKTYPNLKYTEKQADKSLQKNVQALFSGELCEKMMLIESLQIIVKREETFMSEREKAKFHRSTPHLHKGQKANIKKFYPCLVALIDALLTYCDPDLNREATVDHIVLDVWRGVMSDLNEIFSVIIFGKDTELLELGSYPTDWVTIINERNKKVASIRSAARDIEQAKIKLKDILNERGREIDTINAKYANQESQLKLYNSDAQGLAKSLESCTKVTSIVEDNLKRVKDIQS